MLGRGGARWVVDPARAPSSPVVKGPGNIGCFFSLGCNFSKFFSMGQPLRFFLNIFKILVKGNHVLERKKKSD
jgi:hypothetical protein